MEGMEIKWFVMKAQSHHKTKTTASPLEVNTFIPRVEYSSGHKHQMLAYAQQE
jgi:hypothetical protein